MVKTVDNKLLVRETLFLKISDKSLRFSYF